MSSYQNDRNLDDAFARVAQQAGGIQPLLDSFFGFLHRSTDFYVVYDPNSKDKADMGFPPEKAMQMLVDSFSRFPYKEYNAITRPRQGEVISQSHLGANISANSKNSTDKQKTQKTNSKLPHNKPPYNEDGKQIPIGNGGVGPNYLWSQTLTEVTIYIAVETGIRGKDVKCTIATKSIILSIKDVVILEGEWEDNIKREESTWIINLSDGNAPEIVITLDKARKTWWKHAIVGHPEIDTSKVDSTQKIDEYDETTQAAIRKIMFEQRQKMLGIDVSVESTAGNVEEMLASALKVPGGPSL